MTYYHCKIEDTGHSPVIAAYNSVEGLAMGADFITGDVTATDTDENLVWTGSAVGGAIDGSIVKNYKVVKQRQVCSKTQMLIMKGFDYSAHHFLMDMNLHMLHNSMAAMVNSGNIVYPNAVYPAAAVRDSDGALVKYQFTNNADFNAWFKVMGDRMNSLVDGETDLLISIRAAANTQAAMDAISDTRT